MPENMPGHLIRKGIVSEVLGRRKCPEVAKNKQPLVLGDVRPKSDATAIGMAALDRLRGLIRRAIEGRAKPFHAPAGLGETSVAWRGAMVAGVLLLLFGIPATGYWVSNRIDQVVVQNSARLAAVYMRSFIEPWVQNLVLEPRLPEDAEKVIDDLFKIAPLGKQVLSLEIRHRDGTVVYSKNTERLGTKAAMEEQLTAALAGEIQIERQDDHHDQKALEEEAKVPLYEIYAPIYKAGTSEVIGVAEFYEVEDKLYEELSRARKQAWLVLSLMTLASVGALYAMVWKGHHMINAQCVLFDENRRESARLFAENTELLRKVDTAHKRGAEINERSLRRIGADLHDGPAQLLGLALLKLDELTPHLRKDGVKGRGPHETLELVRRSTADALEEIRNIAAGLVVPEVERVSLASALELAAKSHEKRTRSSVERKIGNLPNNLPLPITICLYRFAQETLNNAYRHAGGKGQRIEAKCDGREISVEVADAGPGFDVHSLGEGRQGLGLVGLRDRIESLGGTFEIISAPGKGTRLVVRFTNLPVAARA